ncbi:MAG: HlyD family efflux transporter periplasmic adaptor subunit [Aureispira sp.]|nr:HlyD family efflux transporter periplasmic adaptor subunit [Aureispira sp.]
MLNLSENRVRGKNIEAYDAFRELTPLNIARKLSYWVLAFFIIMIIIMMLPWTQNVPTKGKLTTLRPEQRPQSVYSTIAGRIERWYVREGQSVQKGDTLAFLSEVKAAYFDPKLLERTQNQVDAKNASREAYSNKAAALGQQWTALQEALELKLEQSRNKVRQYELKLSSDSMNLGAAQTAYTISEYQYRRTDTLFQKGLKSLSDLEAKRNKLQATSAKVINAENKLLSTKNDLINAQIELNSIRSQYADKMAKVRSDQSSALSSIYDAESQVAKLETAYSNYEQRSQFYYVIAPQDGYIIEILKKGIGEVIKDSEPLLSIMPAEHDLAVEVFVRPMDYPLLETGQQVFFIFDGWPAFVFSGWPNQSYGTFGGRIVSIDNIANKKGQYRVLVSPDPDEKPWPKTLRVGTGASGMIMLNDVQLWYEFWRQLNGFPPDFYEAEELEKYKLKAPAKHFAK